MKVGEISDTSYNTKFAYLTWTDPSQLYVQEISAFQIQESRFQILHIFIQLLFTSVSVLIFSFYGHRSSAGFSFQFQGEHIVSIPYIIIGVTTVP